MAWVCVNSFGTELIFETEPLCIPWEIESRLQSLLNSYGLNWFKSSVKIIVQV